MWKPSKLGVVNFRYNPIQSGESKENVKQDEDGEKSSSGFIIDREEFPFEDGKLLLKGTNGVGKTSLLQAFFHQFGMVNLAVGFLTTVKLETGLKEQLIIILKIMILKKMNTLLYC